MSLFNDNEGASENEYLEAQKIIEEQGDFVCPTLARAYSVISKYEAQNRRMNKFLGEEKKRGSNKLKWQD